ncbi:iron chelate uptake ABC transporter family permease subunit [Embleya sp. NPDC005575]|uniref:iron chelate uptake ABC transporter family permease subunit n=1 Tax=Embleya sp. NPDC005575 TaxID=3156892 RepID=UPI0033A8575D
MHSKAKVCTRSSIVFASLAIGTKTVPLADVFHAPGGSREGDAIALLVVATCLASVAAASAGPVAFIALGAPRIARRLTGTAGIPLIASGLVGAATLLAGTVVIVLHELDHACRYADHLVAMRAGRVVASGPPPISVTPELVREVFDLRTSVIACPASGLPLVIPLGGRREATEPPRRA